MIAPGPLLEETLVSTGFSLLAEANLVVMAGKDVQGIKDHEMIEGRGIVMAWSVL